MRFLKVGLFAKRCNSPAVSPALNLVRGFLRLKTEEREMRKLTTEELAAFKEARLLDDLNIQVSGSFESKAGDGNNDKGWYSEEITVKVHSSLANKEACHAQADEIRNAINDYLENLVSVK